MKLWVGLFDKKILCVWKVVIVSFVLFICVLQWVSIFKGHNFSTRKILIAFLFKVLIVHPIYFLNVCFWCYCEKFMLVLLTTPPRSWSSASIFKCNAHISKSNQPVLHKTKSPPSFSIVHYIRMYTTIWKIKYLLPFHYDFNEHHQCESDKTSANKHLSATTFYINTLFSHHKQYQLASFLSGHTFWMSCIKYLFKYWLLVQSAPLSGTKWSTLGK